MTVPGSVSPQLSPTVLPTPAIAGELACATIYEVSYTFISNSTLLYPYLNDQPTRALQRYRASFFDTRRQNPSRFDD